jgi:hypothetical protein
VVYVAVSKDDYDGDGLLNVQEKCLFLEELGIDQDRDGIDDGCDIEIGEIVPDSPQTTNAEEPSETSAITTSSTQNNPQTVPRVALVPGLLDTMASSGSSSPQVAGINSDQKADNSTDTASSNNQQLPPKDAASAPVIAAIVLLATLSVGFFFRRQKSPN